MQLTPRYGSPPLIDLDGDPSTVGAALIGQQRRFVDALGTLDDAAWESPSRCEGWSARDVVVHLESATAFWVVSLAQGMAGEPSRLLATFDPVATPAQMVAASDLDGAAALERFATTADALARSIEGLDPRQRDVLVEAPPGHVSVTAMLHHALWDSWVHERDVMVPLGRRAVEDPHEIAAALRYVAALSPAFAVSAGRSRPATMLVEAVDPDVVFRVVVDGDGVDVVAGSGPGAFDAHLSGGAVDLLEALSRRRPLGAGVRERADDASWLIDGLAEVFDQT